MIKLWIKMKLEEIISPGTKSFPIFNDFERELFFGLWIWALIFSPFQCLDLAKFVSLFGAHCFVGFPGYRVGLFTLGFTIPFHAKKTSWWFQLCSFCINVLTPRLCNKGVLRRCRETDYLFTSLPARPSTRWCWHIYQLTPPLIIIILWNTIDTDVSYQASTKGFFSFIIFFKRPNPDNPNGNLSLKFLCERNKRKKYSFYCKQRTKAAHNKEMVLR